MGTKTQESFFDPGKIEEVTENDGAGQVKGSGHQHLENSKSKRSLVCHWE
jgi:hypothetical protein